MKALFHAAALSSALLYGISTLHGQEAAPDGAAAAEGAAPERGSLVEDRAARKLIEAGDARLDADEAAKAVEIWESVIERYPRSRVRFEAHMKLGNYLLDKERAYDRARAHFELAAGEDNREEADRSEATLKMGICFYEARNYGKSFKVMRDVIEKFPVSKQVNQAYYYIGLGHFQLGHYSRAIEALEKVGTTLAEEAEAEGEKVEAGKRLFVKIEDADLAALQTDQTIKVRCEVASGDAETVECFSVGRNVRIVLGSLLTALGRPHPDNGILEVRGDDKVKVTYVDSHTADRAFDRPVLKDVAVVGDALVRITDGAYNETLRGVTLGREANVELVDADFDLTDEADTLKAVVEVLREKTAEELEAEAAAEAAAAGTAPGAQPAAPPAPANEELPEALVKPEINRFKTVDRLEITLTEVKVVRDRPNVGLVAAPEGKETTENKEASDIKSSDAQPAPAEEKPAESDKPAEEPKGTDGNPAEPESTAAEPPAASPGDDPSIHSGVFHAAVTLATAEEAVEGDEILQALPNDTIQVTYLDERNTTPGAATVAAKARALEGNLGGVRVTRAEITDQELRVQTQLKTASALTNIGNRYKEFGLKSNADGKYQQALSVCEEISDEASRLGGRLLEETYVQLWQIYYEMDKLDLAAAMCQRLEREFPNSGFVDDALLQLADVVRKQGDMQRAIGIYDRLVNMPTSQLRGEAQFGIAECYEQMAAKATGPGAAQLYDRAFQEYKKVFDSFPDSGRVGEAVAKMANYYYQQKDYARAVDTFETVLNDHPDAKFLDVILFNYGRCLYRMERKADARRQFDQLIADFPESPLAVDAKKISAALAKAPAGGAAEGETEPTEKPKTGAAPAAGANTTP